jgi:peptidoglycan/LPS O-acetylase OafA/YrhL
MAAAAWGRATTDRRRVGWLLLPAVVVCGLTPWARDWWWPSLLHPRLEGYVRVVNGNAVFSLFPAVAYVFVGTFVGSLLLKVTPQDEDRFHVRAAGAGALLLAVAIGFSLVPGSSQVDRWVEPGMLVTLRIGTMLLGLAVVRALLFRRSLAPSSPMLALGRASLIVYWVHVELAYGNVSYPLHKALSLTSSLVGYVVIVVLMYGLAVWWLRRPSGRALVPAHMVAPRI